MDIIQHYGINKMEKNEKYTHPLIYIVFWNGILFHYCPVIIF